MLKQMNQEREKGRVEEVEKGRKGQQRNGEKEKR
jgi:hypothetical protein